MCFPSVGPSPQKSASNSEFVTVNMPSKVSTNSKEERWALIRSHHLYRFNNISPAHSHRGDPVANGQVVNGVMNDGRCSVWVGNINWDISEEQLKQLFSRSSATQTYCDL